MRGVYILTILTIAVDGFAVPPHPSVLEIVAEEATLAPHLKSPLLRNPKTRHAIALYSTLHRGEEPVVNHKSKEISRFEIYKMLTHAGFVPRGYKNWSQGTRDLHFGAQLPLSIENSVLNNDHHLHSPDFLQYL